MPPEMIPSHCPFCGEKLGNKEVEGRERLYCRKCDRVIWRNAEPVAAVVVKQENEILLVKRGIEPGKGKWSLPAGFLEIEETAEEAAVRELEEETGLSVEEGKLDFVSTLNMERFPDQRLLATVFAVELDETSGKIGAGSDAEAAELLDPGELDETDKNLRKHFLPALEKFTGKEI